MTKSQRPVNVWDLMTLHDVKKYQDVRNKWIINLLPGIIKSQTKTGQLKAPSLTVVEITNGESSSASNEKIKLKQISRFFVC